VDGRSRYPGRGGDVRDHHARTLADDAQDRLAVRTARRASATAAGAGRRRTRGSWRAAAPTASARGRRTGGQRVARGGQCIARGLELLELLHERTQHVETRVHLRDQLVERQTIARNPGGISTHCQSLPFAAPRAGSSGLIC